MSTTFEHKIVAATRSEERRRTMQAVVLILPALIFLLCAFAIPIGNFLFYSVDNSDLVNNLPRTTSALNTWSGNDIPPDSIYATLAEDIQSASNAEMATVARIMNYHKTGYRMLVLATAKKIKDSDPESPAAYKTRFIEADKRWGESEVWQILKQQSKKITPYYLLSSVDLKIDPQDGITSVPESQSIYKDIFERTFWISTVVTVLCIILGYPVAYLLASTTARTRNLLLLFILLPFWTSLLVRTLSWMIIFQHGGVVNTLLMGLHITNRPLEILQTRVAVYIGMIHILLPFMILPVYSVMRGISDQYMKAARSLGANGFRAFITVYLPLTAPGIGAGTLLVSILALGFYITPELLGAPSDQMISYFVAFYTNTSVNWGMAAALGTWLLIFTGAILLLINRTMKIGGLKVQGS